MRTTRAFLLLAAFTTITGFASACGDARTRALDGLHGVKLMPVRPKPDFTLTDTRGQPFHFASDTHGAVTLLYFGYTNCPDVCPQHMVNIAGALKRMSPAEQSRVRVVFVTTDPLRDTPERLRGWLDNFNRGFIGLTGGVDEVNAIQAQLGLPPAQIESMTGMPPGPRPLSYGVGHAAQVLAFTPDDSLRAEYPSGFTLDDWAHDLPRLLEVTKH
jgi:protein SCO1